MNIYHTNLATEYKFSGLNIVDYPFYFTVYQLFA